MLHIECAYQLYKLSFLTVINFSLLSTLVVINFLNYQLFINIILYRKRILMLICFFLSFKKLIIHIINIKVYNFIINKEIIEVIHKLSTF